MIRSCEAIAKQFWISGVRWCCDYIWLL